MMRSLLFFLAICTSTSQGVIAADALSDQEVLERLTTERPTDRAIAKGLEWLRSQQKEDGHVEWEGKNPTALTAMSLMAHFSAGIDFHDVTHGPWLRRSMIYVLSKQETNGYFGKLDGSRMYGHGICTLMLAEALGTSGDAVLEEQMRSALERAVAVTVAAARVVKPLPFSGGWHYEPNAATSDLSLSGWQLMGLHAAQQVGIPVPEEVIVNAVGYGQRMTDADGRVAYDKPGGDAVALRGLGMLCFAIGKKENDKVVDLIAEKIERNPLTWDGAWFFYRSYYDAVGMSRAKPERWDRYGPRLEGVLVEHQEPAGSWSSPPNGNENEHGKVYMTCMGIMALTVNRHVLPAYQR